MLYHLRIHWSLEDSCFWIHFFFEIVGLPPFHGSTRCTHYLHERTHSFGFYLSLYIAISHLIVLFFLLWLHSLLLGLHCFRDTSMLVHITYLRFYLRLLKLI